MPTPTAPGPGRPSAFGSALAHAIADSGLTLERLSHRLRMGGTPASVATLSYWQTGRSIPTRNRSLRAVEGLERVLGLAEGALLDQLPGDAVSRWDPIADHPETELVQQVLGRMGLEHRPRHATLAIHDCVAVNRERTHHQVTTRQVLRAERPLDHIAMVFIGDVPELEPPWAEAGPGCSLGQVVQLDDIGLVACELRLDHPLAAGEQAMVEYRVTWDVTGHRHPGFNRAVTRGTRYAVLEAVFAGEPPRLAQHFVVPNTTDATRPEGRVETDLEPGCWLQHVAVEPPAGTHGLAWCW